jgi:hypothetical protein
MNARCAARLLAPLLLVSSSAGSVLAETPEWRPGERIASPVRGEVEPRDKLGDQDGVYGRFDGDLTLTLGLGAEFQEGAHAAALARALYYHTAGLSLSYADSLGAELDVRRAGFVGVELRPLFLPRWALDLELGCPLLDLTLDSLALGAGMFVARRAEPDETRAGLELSLGLGVPLFAKADGLWLEARGFVRPALDEGGGVLVALSFYQSIVTPWVQ